MRLNLFALPLLFVTVVGSAQTYQPPALAVRQLAKAHPEFDEQIEAQDKRGGNAAIQAWAMAQAKDGNLLAQLYLAQQYLPEECTHNTAAIHVGAACDPTRLSAIGLKPSFEQMFYWLKKRRRRVLERRRRCWRNRWSGRFWRTLLDMRLMQR